MPDSFRRIRVFILGLLVALSLLFIIAVLFDDIIVRAVNFAQENARWDNFFIFFEQRVNILLLVACIGTYAGGFFLRRLKNVKIVALAAMLSYALSLNAVSCLKNISHRHRPFSPSYGLEIRKLTTAEDRSDSFPSGHTAAAFAMLFPFILYYRGLFVRMSLLLLGGLMAYSRVYLGAHFFSDVIFAAILSIVIAVTVYFFIKNRKAAGQPQNDLFCWLGVFILTAAGSHRPYKLLNLPEGEILNAKFNLHFPLTRIIFEPFLGLAAYFNLSDNIKLQQLNWIIWIGIASIFFIYTSKRYGLLPIRKKIKIMLLIFTLTGCLEILFFSGRLSAYTLVAKDKDALIIDFHTHTSKSYSWQWGPLTMMRQHARSGFHGAFVTDYNTVKGAKKSTDTADSFGLNFLVFPGQEYRGERLHLLLLGIEEDISPWIYSVADAIARTHALNGIVIVPHYFRVGYEDYSVSDLVSLGVDGFEIANRSEAVAPAEKRRVKEIYDICKRKGLLMVGGTDNHGLQSAVYVWNAVKLSGIKDAGKIQISKGIIEMLRRNAQNKITVITLHNPEYRGWLRMVFDPPFSLFYYFRSLNRTQWLSWMVWVCLALGIYKIRVRGI